jgi:hypothetical protein
MVRVRRFLAFLSLSLALAGAVIGIAVGAENALEGLGALPLQASDPPGLLAPISEAGRNGWDCQPEHAATARSAKAAELPVSEQ